MLHCLSWAVAVLSFIATSARIITAITLTTVHLPQTSSVLGLVRLQRML